MSIFLGIYNSFKSFILDGLDFRRDRLFTIGYESLDVNSFLKILKNSDIQTLIDIREIPISRKRGFSQNELEEICKKHDLQYVHFRELGSPTWLRQKLRADRDYGFFFNQYRHYIKNNGGRKFVVEINKLAADRPTCLLCFEKDYKMCHRKVVASEVKKINGNGLKIVHLP